MGSVTTAAVAVAEGDADGVAATAVVEGRTDGDVGVVLAGAGLGDEAQATTRMPTTIEVATGLSRERIAVSFRRPTTAR
jgi:hypothetical protein